MRLYGYSVIDLFHFNTDSEMLPDTQEILLGYVTTRKDHENDND